MLSTQTSRFASSMAGGAISPTTQPASASNAVLIGLTFAETARRLQERGVDLRFTSHLQIEDDLKKRCAAAQRSSARLCVVRKYRVSSEQVGPSSLLSRGKISATQGASHSHPRSCSMVKSKACAASRRRSRGRGGLSAAFRSPFRPQRGDVIEAYAIEQVARSWRARKHSDAKIDHEYNACRDADLAGAADPRLPSYRTRVE